MTDYINDTFIRLTEEGRIRDAVDFCERVADHAPCVEFQCIALKDLAECHFLLTGDGEACREANLRGLRLMDEHPEILEGTDHMARGLIRRMYSDFCEQFRSVAVSFEEYEEHCEKPLKVRARNATETRGLQAVANLKSKNAGWKENMFILLDQYFPQGPLTGAAPGAAQGACLAQLILLNRRKLRTEPLDVNFAMQQYMNSTIVLVDNLISKAEANKRPPVFDQIAFVLDRASDIIKDFRDDRQADQPTVEELLERLGKVRQRTEEQCRRYERQGAVEAAEADQSYLTADKLDKTFAYAMVLLNNQRLKDVDLGLGGRGLDPQLKEKLKKFFGWLLFLALFSGFVYLVWKLNGFHL